MDVQQKYLRSRCYRILMEDALLMLNWHRYAPDFISVPEFPECVPAGAEVLSVHSTYNPMGFAVLVYHSSFDEIPAGEVTPCYPGGPIRLTTRRIATKP